jgi:hypothetical protein
MMLKPLSNILEQLMAMLTFNYDDRKLFSLEGEICQV